MIIFLIISFIILLLFLFSCLKISSECDGLDKGNENKDI